MVPAGEQCRHFTGLPFGWKYLPVICQRLVASIVASALRGIDATWHVYLDDHLVTSKSLQLATHAIQAAAHALRTAGIIISPKFEMTPSTVIIFFGKPLGSVARSISNTPAMMVATTRLWVRVVGYGHMHPREMARLLEPLQWVPMPFPCRLLSRYGSGLHLLHARPH